MKIYIFFTSFANYQQYQFNDLYPQDYLVPSPQSPPPATPNTLNNNKNPYMDLIGEPKSSSGMFLYPPPHGYVIPGMHATPSTNIPNNYFLHLHWSL